MFCMCRSRGGDQGLGLPLKNHKNKGFLSNSGPDPLKNYKASEPAFNVWPSSALQQNAILMAFRWRADDGPLIVVFGSSHPSSTNKKKKKNIVKVGTILTKFSGSVHVLIDQTEVKYKLCTFFWSSATSNPTYPVHSHFTVCLIQDVTKHEANKIGSYTTIGSYIVLVEIVPRLPVK